ncbi:MAG TPA: 3-phosphoshikimate 1-carboxyvinyltransferase, partial [Acidimicrobiia bacterium]|nr:3-phosphoshikimate 1-carboxyvinyltransferase [Acidimicrobiia bacterium]
LSHRALILGAMSPGTSRIAGLGPGLDIASTRSAIEALGAAVTSSGDAITVVGGPGRWQPPGTVDCGNSGTTMRLLAGALAAAPFTSTLVGDASLTRRPMTRLVEPLAALGALITTSAAGTAPIVVDGQHLLGAAVSLGIPSAQVRTAVALAALQADGVTTIASPPGFRDHTERWLTELGLGRWVDDTTYEVTPGEVPEIDLAVPGDPSSAAFVWAAAALVTGSEVTTRGISLNPGRIGFLEILDRMGAGVDLRPTGDVLADPIGDVTIRHGPLRGIRVDGPQSAAAIDELPLVAILATAAEGETIVADAAELRVKESDRARGAVMLVTALGGDAEERPDGFVVRGRPLSSGVVDADGDHRLAMTAAVAASGGGRVEVVGFDATSVSWPGFDAVLEGLWSS